MIQQGVLRVLYDHIRRDKTFVKFTVVVMSIVPASGKTWSNYMASNSRLANNGWWYVPTSANLAWSKNTKGEH